MSGGAGIKSENTTRGITMLINSKLHHTSDIGVLLAFNDSLHKKELNRFFAKMAEYRYLSQNITFNKYERTA